MSTITMINGKAIIKQGRKVIAKIYDRPVYYAANNIKCDIGQFTHSLEIGNRMAECRSLNDAIELMDAELSNMGIIVRC